MYTSKNTFTTKESINSLNTVCVGGPYIIVQQTPEFNSAISARWRRESAILRILVEMDVKTGELLDTVWGLWSCGPSHHISTKWHSIKMQRIVFCLGRTSTITSAQQRRNMKTTDKYRGAAPAACGHLKPIKNFTCYCVITMCENIHYVRRKGCSPHGH